MYHGCTASMPTVRPSIRLSVHECAEEEAQRHKWIESEKAGRDQGEWAIRCWVHHHWNRFLRDRWIEHLQGLKFWIELDHDDFGFLERVFPDYPLFNDIVDRIKAGRENLDIISWAIDKHLPMEEVHNILLTFNINSHRIECQLERRLSGSN